MDLVLEVADTYLFDKVYAHLFPAALNENLPSTIKHYFNSANTSSPHQIANDFLQSTLSYQGAMLKIFENASGVEQKHIYGIHSPLFFPESCYTYASLLPRSNIFRQAISLFIIMTIFGWLLYLSVASLSYFIVFDKSIFNHPRYLKNQMSLEINQLMTAIPVMVTLTVPWFLLELKGYSKLYLNIDESTGGWKLVLWQLPTFIMFTDCFIYLLHRWLHWPQVYKLLHKPHHKWIVCTPFASHLFHPVDGYIQSLPYHWFPFLFPLHKISYLLLFTFVNFWTVMIHDGEYLSNDPVINGAACHTIHHLYFNYNYGQFTTLWDRLGNSYRKPDQELFDKKLKNDSKVWQEQVVKMEAVRDVLEGHDDDRVYINDVPEKTLKQRRSKK